MNVIASRATYNSSIIGRGLVEGLTGKASDVLLALARGYYPMALLAHSFAATAQACLY
jgi:hypothetical protein